MRRLLFLGYAAFLLSSLPQYGPVWDVVYEFPRATAFVSHAFGDVTPTGASPWHVLSYEQARAGVVVSMNGCLPSLLCALTGRLMFERLGLLDPIDAWHLALVLLWLLFLLHFHARLAHLHGRRLAFVATVLLALAPRVLGHVPNNMKDVPAMAFGTMALLELAVAVTRDRPRRVWLAGLWFACAVSSKFLAGMLVVPAVVLLYLGLKGDRFVPRLPRRYWLPLASVPVATLAVFVGHWPHLWQTPAALWQNLRDLNHLIGTRVGGGPSLYPVVMTGITAPIVWLVGLLGALLFAGRSAAGARHERMLLVVYVVWVATVLAVFCSGGMELFDGVRHFLSLQPALAILAAFGLIRGFDAVFARWRTKVTWLQGLPAAVALAGSCVPVALYHPYEVTYFNALVGGLPGATGITFGDSVVEFEPRDYWGSSTRACVEWANHHLPAEAPVWVSLPPAFGALKMYDLRPDLRYAEPSTLPAGTTYYLVFLNRSRWFGELEHGAIDHGELLHQETSRGVPLSFVYRLTR